MLLREFGAGRALDVIVYEFVPFTAALNEPFSRLFAREGFHRSSDYLRWAHRSRAGQSWAALARDSTRGGEIIGVMALVSTQLRAGTQTHTGFQAVDLVVDPVYRGRGIFMGLGAALLDGAASLGADVVWGFPNESAAHAWFEHFHWVRLGPVPYMIRPLRSGFVLGRIVPALERINVRLAPHLRPVPGLRPVRRFGPETDRLWQAFAGGTGCAIDRGADWLNWRIFERPGTEYRTVAVFDGNEMAAFVTSATVKRHGGLILYVLEALCRGKEKNPLLTRLLQHEVANAADCGADAALCWCSATAPNRRAYLRAGFLPLPEWMRPTKTYFGVKPLRPLPQDMTSKDGWYLSLLDFDAL